MISRLYIGDRWRLVLLLPLLVMGQGCGGGSGDAGSSLSEQPQTVDASQIDQSEFDDVDTPSSCEGVALDEDCVEAKSHALRLDAERKLGFESVTFDKEAMQLRILLRPGFEPPKRLQVGAPIYRARRDRKPFMAIIESIDRDGPELTLSVRRASLTSVFERGRVRMRIPIDPAQKAIKLKEPIVRPKAESFGTIININCAEPIIDGNYAGIAFTPDGFPALNTIGSAELYGGLDQCSVTVGGYVDAIVKWGTFSLNLFEVVGGVSLDIVMEAGMSMSNVDIPDATIEAGFTTLHASKETRIARLPSATVVVAGLNITITPEVYAGVGFESEAEVSSSAGFEYHASAEAGFGYAKGTGAYLIKQSDRDLSQIGPTFEQEADEAYQRAHIRPQLNVSVGNDLLGATGSIGLEGYIEVDSSRVYKSQSSFDTDLCYDVDGGLQAVVGAELTALSIDLFDKEWDLRIFETNVTDGCFAENVVATPVCGSDDECRVDADCAPDSLTSCSVYSCQSDCSCGATFERANCCSTSADCDDGDPSTRDICMAAGRLSGDSFAGEGSCQYVPIIGYCETNRQCDDGDLTTDDICTDNRCQHNYIGAAAQENFAASPQCRGDFQCDDGNPATADLCLDYQCQSVFDAGAPDADPLAAGYRCSADIDCDDGQVLTEDLCDTVNGLCSNIRREFVPPRELGH